MKKYFKIYSEMNEEVVHTLIEFMNGLDEDDTVDINISSIGGSTVASTELLDIINNDDRILKVNYYWEVSSVAFNLMRNTKKDKRIINKDVWSVLHLSGRSTYTNDILKKDQEVEMLLKHLNKSNKKMLKEYEKLGVTEKEIKKIKKGKDVYYFYEDIKRILG